MGAAAHNGKNLLNKKQKAMTNSNDTHSKRSQKIKDDNAESNSVWCRPSEYLPIFFISEDSPKSKEWMSGHDYSLLKSMSLNSYSGLWADISKEPGFLVNIKKKDLKSMDSMVQSMAPLKRHIVVKAQDELLTALDVISISKTASNVVANYQATQNSSQVGH